MPRGKPQKAKNPQRATEEAFLRSINVVFDAEESGRIAHFVPTGKGAALIKALIGFDESRANFVVAPYGSGKSLTAAYVLHLVENRRESRAALKEIEGRLAEASSELCEFARQRRRRKKAHGLTLALHGYAPSLPRAIKRAALESLKRLRLGRESRPISSLECELPDQLVELLAYLNDCCKRQGFDRVVIVWDEFGKHLESLVTEGRASALLDLQILAEFVSRSSFPMTLGLLLHQGLLQYAGALSQTARNEWIKIEGRFNTIEYVDDSKQVYRLIARVVSESAGQRGRPIKAQLGDVVRKAKKLGMFQEFGVRELRDLLSEAYPLTPTTLYLLPRISARVAQNERTLFNFLFTSDLNREQRPADLYDFFSPQMRSDIAIGGTQRRWLETESAIAKATDIKDADAALKTACLLGLGLAGQRAKPGLSLLRFACRAYRDKSDWPGVIDQLIDRRLLLHRKHSDEVAIWHGTDLDVRGRLEAEKSRRSADFDLLAFLREETPPPAWKSHEYNAEYGVGRYFPSQFETPDTLGRTLGLLQTKGLDSETDGQIFHVLADAPDALAQARELAAACRHDRVLVVVPRESLPVRDAALEVYCLLAMQSDPELVNSDPLALDEVKQLTDDAHAHLQRLLDRLVVPSTQGASWYYRGKPLEVITPRTLRRCLSDIMREVYPLTPRINNEMIVRKKPSPIGINARKKLVLGILERSGQENLGLIGNFPDSSMFRTVLLHTRLYKQHHKSGRWVYSEPTGIEVKDEGLKQVWGILKAYFTEPSKEPKGFASLIERLKAPPYGLRAGPIPILIAAAYKAFARAVSLRKAGEFIPDILPSDIEDICRNPENYELEVLDVNRKAQSYLKRLYETFKGGNGHVRKASNGDLIRACYDAIEEWKDNLPAAARTSDDLSPEAEAFRDVLFQSRDPVDLLIRDLPAISNGKRKSDKGLLERVKAELEAAADAYRQQAGAALKRALGAREAQRNASLAKVARMWAECFDETFINLLTNGTAKQLLTRMSMPYDSDAKLLDSLAVLMIGRPLRKWDDNAALMFERRVREAVHDVEEHALREADTHFREAVAKRLSALALRRIEEYADRLEALIGRREAVERLQEMIERLRAGREV